MYDYERAAEIDRINAALADIRGTARCADGSVAIETDVNGRITNIYVADYAMDDGPKRLESLIADTHRKALDDALAGATRIYETEDRGRRDARTRGY